MFHHCYEYGNDHRNLMSPILQSSFLLSYNLAVLVHSSSNPSTPPPMLAPAAPVSVPDPYRSPAEASTATGSSGGVAVQQMPSIFPPPPPTSQSQMQQKQQQQQQMTNTMASFQVCRFVVTCSLRCSCFVDSLRLRFISNLVLNAIFAGPHRSARHRLPNGDDPERTDVHNDGRIRFATRLSSRHPSGISSHDAAGLHSSGTLAGWIIDFYYRFSSSIIYRLTVCS